MLRIAQQRAFGDYRLLCCLVLIVVQTASGGDVIDVGNRRELFVDDTLIGELNGTKLKLHEPHRLMRVRPRPFGYYATVLKDGDRLRLYYRGDRFRDVRLPCRFPTSILPVPDG